MTDIEQKALALVNEVATPGHVYDLGNLAQSRPFKALLRAIEQHEAFRQEVSDAVVAAKAYYEVPMYDLSAFIIAKPDPLVEAVQDWWDADGYNDVANLRAAIEKRGGKIIFNEE